MDCERNRIKVKIVIAARGKHAKGAKVSYHQNKVKAVSNEHIKAV